MTEFIEEHIPYPRRVFCNRDLRMDSLRYIGFDMDYTLALYKRSMEFLQAELVLKGLVSKMGYERAVLAVKYDPDFAIRGLSVDLEHGNVFKMNSHRFVGQVWHGNGVLEKELRRQTYTNRKLAPSDPGIVMVDTQFSLPEISLYCQLVAHLEKESKNLDFRKLWEDLRSTMDQLHRDDSLKAIVRGDIPKYVHKDQELGETLHRFRSAGNKLFVLTNSEPVYTEAVMSHLLDGIHPGYPRWMDYFDFVIASARKPIFFNRSEPLLAVDSNGELSDVPVKQLKRGVIYSGGNLDTIKSLTGMRGDEVLYVGDHIYGDIMRSKRDTMWRTAMVVQELESELSQIQAMGSEVDDLEALEDELFQINLVRAAQKVEGKEDRTLVQKAKSITKSITRLERDLSQSFNPIWGAMFRDRSELSAFGGQVQSYACLYTSRVTNLKRYSPLWYFRTPRQRMPHEQRRVLSQDI
jgi:HAD superfamily 5'-nucleotidase-like hydrolase